VPGEKQMVVVASCKASGLHCLLTSCTIGTPRATTLAPGEALRALSRMQVFHGMVIEVCITVWCTNCANFSARPRHYAMRSCTSERTEVGCPLSPAL
jgi:hypothetical protein